MAATAVQWKAMVLDALKANKKLMYSKYVQLATVRPNGRPANRTVVFRGFWGETSNLTFVTDARTEKVKELADNPYAEVAWYLPDSREQFRISGTLEVVSKDHEDEKKLKARQAAWHNMSDGGRSQFAWLPPGELLGTTGEEKEASEVPFSPVPERNEPAMDTFCLMVLEPESVDYLHLKKNVRSRHTKDEDGSWRKMDLNP